MSAHNGQWTWHDTILGKDDNKGETLGTLGDDDTLGKDDTPVHIIPDITYQCILSQGQIVTMNVSLSAGISVALSVADTSQKWHGRFQASSVADTSQK